MDAATLRALDLVRKHERDAVIEEQKAVIAKQAKKIAKQSEEIAAQAEEITTQAKKIAHLEEEIQDVKFHWKDGLNFAFWSGNSEIPFLPCPECGHQADDN